jgi:PAS domain S-box-containing protein
MRGRSQIAILLAVAAGLLASGLLGLRLRQHETRVLAAHYQGNLATWAHALEREVEVGLEALHALRAIGEGPGGVDPDSFRRLAASALERHPEFRSLGFAPCVEGADRGTFEAEARRAGFAGFEIRQAAGADAARSGHVPLLLVETRGSAPGAIGFDLASERARADAIASALRSGQPQVTAPTRRLVGQDDIPTLVAFMPVRAPEPARAGSFCGDVRGFMVAVFVIEDLLAGAMRHAELDLDVATLEIVDAAAPERQASVFSRPGGGDPSAAVPAQRVVIDVIGRPWEIRAQPSVAYAVARRGWRPHVAGLVGAALSMLAGAAALLLRRQTAVVERLVEVRTEDLTRANAALAEQKQVLQSVLDNLGDGVAVADATGRLTLLNPAAEAIVGLGLIDSGPEDWSRLYGLYRVDGETPLAADELPLARAVAGSESRDVDMFVRNPRRAQGVYIRVTATPLRGASGRIHGGVAVFRDITGRRWAEKALRESEARFRSIVEATGSALVILSAEHRILEFNPEAERIYGRKRADVLGQDFLALFLPQEYRGMVAADIEQALRGKAPLDIELPIRAGTGENRVLLLGISRLVGVDGEVLGAVATGHDVTERREAEEAQRVRQLAAHLQSAREGERKHAAREIHDELGQVLTGLKFEFSHLARRLGPVDPAVRAKITSLEGLIDGTIASVRRIAAELRPQILDKLGLFEAIRWQAEEFEKRTGIECALDLPAEELDWSPDRSTAVFRIFQESLTNVARHSGARRVRVRVHRDPAEVELSVCDDGRGIREDELVHAQSFGLMGMRERARMFGGTLTVAGSAAAGTEVRVRIPL